jgi:hypothetical protein
MWHQHNVLSFQHPAYASFYAIATILTPFYLQTSASNKEWQESIKTPFRPPISSVAVLVITAIFSMIESVEFTNRAFSKVFILIPTIYNAFILARVDFFHLPTQ